MLDYTISSYVQIIAIQTLPTPAEKYIMREGMAKEKRFEIDLRRSRHDSVMKVLYRDPWFWLEKDYANENGKIVCKGNILPDDFFSNGVPYITISAIVGENGMGKSSLLELLYRLINYTTYALKEGLDAQKYTLHFVRDIYAKVWFKDDETIYYIEQFDNKIRFYNQNEDKVVYEYDYVSLQENKTTNQEAKGILKKLF